jgi:hypothetical protein
VQALKSFYKKSQLAFEQNGIIPLDYFSHVKSID